MVFLASLPMGGILGSWARSLDFDRSGNEVIPKSESRRELRPNFLGVVIPGVAAAFVVPLFLSIGQNSVISQILSGSSVTAVLDKLLVVFGFCILAGATASNFINGLAKRALEVAKDADEKASRADAKSVVAEKQAKNAEIVNDEQKDLITELFEASKVDKDDDRGKIDPIDREKLDTEEIAVLDAISRSSYSRRTVTGISNDTGISKPKVRSILSDLIDKGLINEITSKKTGGLVYQIRLKN